MNAPAADERPVEAREQDDPHRAPPRNMAYSVQEESSGHVLTLRVTQQGILLRPKPWWVEAAIEPGTLFLFGWWVYPLWLLCARIRAELEWNRLPDLAVFTRERDVLRAEIFDPRTWTMTSDEWPLSAIVEFRPNRYCPGIWLHVRGVIKDTLCSPITPEIARDIQCRLGFGGAAAGAGEGTAESAGRAIPDS